MTDLLGLAAVVPASAGACCTVGAWRPGRAVDVVAALAMVAAMLDGVIAPRVLPGFAWFAVLACLAVVLAATARFQRTRTAVGADRAVGHGRAGRLHAALGLLVMGAMGVGMSHAAGAGAASMHDHAGAVGATWQLVLGGLTLGYLVLTVVMVRDGLRHRGRLLPLVETSTMGVAVAVMAAGMG